MFTFVVVRVELYENTSNIALGDKGREHCCVCLCTVVGHNPAGAALQGEGYIDIIYIHQGVLSSAIECVFLTIQCDDVRVAEEGCCKKKQYMSVKPSLLSEA